MFKRLQRLLLAIVAVLLLFSCSTCAYAVSTSGLTADNVAQAEFPKITTQPKSVTVNSGETATIRLVATGEGLTYKWYFKNASATKFSPTDTFKGNSYYVTMNSTRAGRQVYCVVSDKYGNSVKSNTVTLKMAATTAAPVKITSQPVSVTVANGAKATVKVVATGEGLTYKWYFKDTDDSKFALTKTFTGNSYSVTMGATRAGRQVYCVVSDKYGNSVKSNTATLKMAATTAAPVKITSQPVSVTVANGAKATVKVVATGEGLTYKWYFKDTDDSKFALTKTFTGNSYSVTMGATRAGRQVYCVVTDKYGNSVKSDTVTLHIKPTIVTQPQSVTVAAGSEAVVPLKAVGEGLTYQWYYRNPGGSSFRVSSVTTDTYTVAMISAKDGRQIYCVVTDKHGNTVTSDIATLSMKHINDSGVITKQPTCSSKGEKIYTCKECGKKTIEVLDKLPHDMQNWTLIREATAEHEGVERKLCENCSYYQDRPVKKLTTKYTLTIDTGTETYRVGVADNGKYSLKTPTKAGQTFRGWVDSNGNAISSSGTINSSQTIYATWETKSTKTLADLVANANAGASEIRIAADITVTEPVFISYKTKIYSDGNYTIKRDSNYNGDIFVVGQDKNGIPAVQLHRNAVLDLGGGMGTLTIDGNRDNLNGTVVGSAVYVSDSATLNIYDGVKIANHQKLGNERVLTNDEFVGDSTTQGAGGAAVLNLNATVNMYGGVMENNAVYTQYTTVTNSDGIQESLSYNALGGAVYNRGNFNMYGGTITGSEALRGGGIYSDFIAYLHAGTISNNIAHAYGGGLSTSSAMSADIYVGTEKNGSAKMVFSGNYCKGVGGAMYSNTSSPIIVLGNAEFVDNVSDTSGGAIYTAGPLTVRNSCFTGNSSVGSGGAIYHHYTKAEFERRHMTLENCTFEENKSNLGGAVILSATGAAAEAGEGTIATISNCTFTGNQAVLKEGSIPSGGAIYITKKSVAEISGCTFDKNSSLGNAGAMAAQGGTEVTLAASSFTENTALQGGGIYTSGAKSLTLTDLTFTGNSAVINADGGAGLGGGLFIDKSPVTLKNIDLHSNTAGVHGGAGYIRAVTVNLDADSEISGNKAAQHGGAFYLTYQNNADSTKTGAVLNAKGTSFSNNSAMAGGVVSARTACAVNLDEAILLNNTVEGCLDGKNDGDSEGGGAIYVGYGTATLENVTATGNTASDFGGVVDAVNSPVTLVGGSYVGNKANSGGVVYARNDSDVSIDGAAVNENESVFQQDNTKLNSDIGGGAINMVGGSLTVKNTSMSGNKTDYYGGAILAAKAKVSISDKSAFSASSGATGAALYFKSSCAVTITDTSITDNTSNGNGVVYQNGGTLDITNLAATGNSANSGGVLYTSGSSTKVTLNGSSLSNNYASTGGVIFVDSATMTISDSEMKESSAKNGGAIYSRKGILEITDSTYSGNAATSGSGGAIYMVGGTVNVTGESKFSNNTATSHAGGIYATYFTNDDENKTKVPSILAAKDTVFEGNSAMGGGAISIRTDCEATLESVKMTNNSVTGNDGKADGYGENGGAVYVGYGKLTMNSVTLAGNTSEKYGGAVQVVESSATITGGSFSDNEGGTGGAIYVCPISTASVKDVAFTGNSAMGNAGALYVGTSAFTASNLDFSKNSCSGNGGALYLTAVELDVDSQWTFSDNSAGGHGGAIYAVYRNNDDGSKTGTVLNVADVTFDSNSAMAGGAISARTACVVNLDGTKLTNNSVSGIQDDGKADTEDNDGNGEGGGAVYVGFGTATLKNVTATGNTASDFGGVVDAVDTPVTIIGGTYSDNTANNGGVIHAMENSTVTITNATLTNNRSPYIQTGTYNEDIGGGAIHAVGGMLDISESVLDGNSSGYYGGAIHTNKTKVTINNNSTLTNSVGGTGAACYFAGGSDVTIENSTVTNNKASANGVIYQSGTLSLDNVSATVNEAAVGGVLYASGNSAKVTLKNSTWSDNSASEGGAVYLKNGATVDLIDSALTGNAAKYGGAVYAYNGATLNLSNVAFQGNKATTDGGAIYTKAAAVVGTDTADTTNTFVGNSAENHGGAIYVNYLREEGKADVPGTLTLTGGLLQSNSAKAGGAISSRTGCTVSLTSTQLKQNNASAPQPDNLGGGAIYTNDGTLTLSGVTLEGNTSAYYGGAIRSANSTVTMADNCVIKENEAVTGTALWLNVGEGNTAMLTDLTLTENLRSTGNSNGVIYANGAGTLDIKRLTASNNVSSNGGVLYTSGMLSVTIVDSTLVGNEALTTGGVLSYRGSGTMTITGTTISDNTSENGGAIEASGSGTVTIKTSVLERNSATENGGALYVTDAGTVVLSDGTTLNDNTAKIGGAIYQDLGGSVTIDGCVLRGNSSTGGDGGAIYVADSGEGSAATRLVMTGTTLKENIADSKGGALSTDTGSPNLVISAVNCSFMDNKASGAGGGAVEIQNGNCNSAADPTQVTIAFLGCSFTGNTAKTTGGAVEIRTNSCAKVDGITASGNKASSNGGVFYVTSNYSRLYLTGVVSISGNTASSGSFVYLYNNKYTTPPKIYTTHSSDATWYKEVGGNKTSIAFDLTTMP